MGRLGSAAELVVGVRVITAGRSPNWLTMVLKCSGMVWVINGG